MSNAPDFSKVPATELEKSPVALHKVLTAIHHQNTVIANQTKASHTMKILAKSALSLR